MLHAQLSILFIYIVAREAIFTTHHFESLFKMYKAIANIKTLTMNTANVIMTKLRLCYLESDGSGK